MRPTLRFATGLALTIVGWRPAVGQSVRGVITDSASGQPLPGAVVWLADTAGGPLARSVSGPDGHYAVLRLAGAVQLHVLRIGFHPAVVPVSSPANRDTTIDVRLGAVALVLDPVASSRRRVCPGDKGTSDALQLWEQVRAALLASVVARDADPPELRLRSYTRSFEPVRHRLVAQEIRGRDVVGDHSYVAARPAWALAEDGYMREGRSGERTFYAPDEDVLLDPSFADTHCLHVVIGQGDHAHDVGIGFDPVKEHGRDTLVDVNGVLWIDSLKHELQTLDFQYTDLEVEARGSGGQVFFATMPNGTPMITAWVIRAAVLASEAPSRFVSRHSWARDSRRDVRLMQWREEGGAVAWAHWPSGQTWRGPMRRISGKLVGELGRGLAGVRVWLYNGPDTVTSDSTGTYTLDAVLPGTYMVLAADSGLAAMSLVQGQRLVDVSGGDHLEASILVLPPRMIFANRCKGQPMPAHTGALIGRVTDVSGAPVANASISATWSTPEDSVAGDPKPDRAVQSDEDGRFAICGVPIGATVRLHGGRDAQSADVQWTQRELMTLSLVLRPAPGG